MEDFRFKNDTEIIFGRDKEAEVGQEVEKYADTVLVHYGGGSIKEYGTYDTVMGSLNEAGLEVHELGGVQPNPRLSLIREGIRLCKEEGIEFILAVGGGSVIDSSKAISLGVKSNKDIWEFYKGGEEEEPEEVLPVGVVLTLAAAGSEASTGSVITKEEGKLKRAFNDQALRPKFAVLNPELTKTLPDYQTASGAADIMAHVMERYFTNTESVGLTDRLCEGTLRTIIDNLPNLMEDPEDYDARAEVMWASTVAHNDLLGTGREEDWASHGIEHEISGIYDVTHGAGLAVVFPAWMKYVYEHDLERFAQFADRVWGVETDYGDLEKTALEGIYHTEEFFSRIGLPTRLSEMDIDDSRIEEMAEKCTANGPVGNFVELEKEDIEKIYRLAL